MRTTLSKTTRRWTVACVLVTVSGLGPVVRPAEAQLTADIIALYETTCAALPSPLPDPVTSVSPGVDYCISSTASDHEQDDTMTISSVGVSGEMYALHLCFTNSAGFDPCADPGPGGSPYVIPLDDVDANSFVGVNTDFNFEACSARTLELTFSYDGPELDSDSDIEELTCAEQVPSLPPLGLAVLAILVGGAGMMMLWRRTRSGRVG